MDIEIELGKLKNWKLQDNKIIKDFIFKNFIQTMVFINKVAEFAEELNHHPDMYISYNKVKIELTTHEVGGVSEKDFVLAKKIDDTN